MIILGIAGVSLLIIFYLYVRTEGLRREMSVFRRQLTTLNAEIDSLEGSVEALAFEHQIELGKKLTRAKLIGHPDANLLKYSETMVAALVSVAGESAKGQKNVSESFKKVLAKTTDISFGDFNDFISGQNDSLKTDWHKKSMTGYLSVCNRLIEQINGNFGED